MSFVGGTNIEAPTSDAVSQLVQMIAKKLKLTGMAWTGRGHEDVQLVVRYAKNQETARHELWGALADIVRHPAIKAVMQDNEDLQAETSAHILRARGNIELKYLYALPLEQPSPPVPNAPAQA